MKKGLGILICCILGGVAVFFSYDKLSQHLPFIQGKSTTLVLAELQETHEIDKLYTGFYMIPLLDINKGKLKRQIVQDTLQAINPFKETPQQTELVTLGYCLRKYAVSIGYEDVMEILSTDMYRNDVCSGKIDSLPSPHILDVNPVSTKIEGKYTGSCQVLDSHPEERKKILMQELQKNNIAEDVSKKSKKSLSSFISLFCK